MIKIGNIDFTDEKYIIDIRDKSQVIKARVVIPDDAVYGKYLMKKDDIQFSFEYDSLVSFVRGDYIEYDGARFVLDDENSSVQENTQRFVYSLVFQADYMLLKNTQMYYVRQNLKEVSWSLTSDASSFIKIVVDNANRYFNTTDWQVGTVEPTGMKYINFDSTSVLDALTQIAEQFDAEWYITGKTINLVNKLSYGSEIDFESEVSVVSMARSEGENSTKFNRIVALGSTRNIPANYRQTTPSEGVDAIYQKRLRIPASKGDVIDAYPNMSPEEVVEGSVIFDDVYPQRTGTMSDITTKEYTDTDEETEVVTKWNAYRYKDTGLSFKESYILPGQELRIVFQSGKLNGMDFAVKFNPDDYPESSSDSQVFEIIRSEDYGAKLPNDTLKPENGDKYILYGFDIQLVSDQYIPEAEQELYDKALEWLKNNLKDKSVYTCPAIINHFAENSMDLDIGQNVKLIKSFGGNRNLLRNTNFVTDSRYWMKTGSYNPYPTVNAKPNGSNNNSLYIETPQIGSAVNNILTQPTIKLAVGKTYTLSFWAAIHMQDAILHFELWGGIGAKNFFVPAGWAFFTHTFTVTASNPDQSLYFWINKVGSFYLNNIKLEESESKTDWSLSPEDVKDGIRSSRIMGFEKKLYNIYEATYTVGDNAVYSRLANIEKDIEELKYAGQVYQNTGGGNVYLIKQFDTTTPTDFNAYSAKASNARFLKRDQEDSALRKITFADGIDVKKGAVSNMFGNESFTSGQFGSGFRMWQADNGQSYAELDNLMVRREMIINTLTIAEIKSVGGQILVSLANMYVTKVEERADSYRCFFETDNGTIPNQFSVDDQAICRKFNGQGLKYYWRRVLAIGSDYIDLSKVDRDGSSIPAEGDEIIQFGNRTNTNRQSAIMISAYGSDSPSIKQYAGINTYNLTGKEVTVISPLGNKFTGEFKISTNGTTSIVYKDRETFSNVTTYYLNDRVSYNGAYWVCIAPEGQSTSETPSETALYWRQDTTSQGDINNAIDNIQIGGVNLLRNTAFTNDTNYWVGEGAYKISVNDAKPSGSNNNTLYVNGSVVGGSFNHVFTVPTKRLIVGKTYTLSFWAALDSGTANVHFEIWGGIGSKNFSVKEGWQFYTHTFEITANNNEQSVYFWFDRASICYFNSIKLEEGNKSTAWSAAPEDIQGQITNVEKNVTQVQSSLVVLNDKIESKVSQTDFNSLQGRVSTAESNITQQADLIQSTVEKVDKKNAVYKSYTSASNDRPGVPYAKGDLWITYDGTILQSNTNRLDGLFVESDWVPTTKYIDESAIDDIQIGGVNLLRNTNFSTNASYWGRTGSYNPYPTPNAKPNGSNNNSLYIETPQIGSAVNNILTQPTIKLEVGKTYTLSFWAAIHMQAATLHFELWGGIGAKNFSVPAGWAFYTHTFTVTASNPDQSLYFWINKVGSFYLNNIKLEEGNKSSAWSLAPEDIQAGIDKAQNTADSKIRTFYSDTQPSTPDGGFKDGDLWYKINTIDGYYETYRWNWRGYWDQINVSVSKAKQIITDNSITNLVERTGIDNLGTGETLWSKINQTADEISLEVSQTQIGGSVNLLRNTAFKDGTRYWSNSGVYKGYSINTVKPSGSSNNTLYVETTASGSDINSILTQAIKRLEVGKTYTLSFWGAMHMMSGIFHFEMWGGIGSINFSNPGNWRFYTHTFSVTSDNPDQSLFFWIDKVTPFYINNIQLVEGDKALGWQPSQEDTLNEIGSKLTINQNKISLASTTIELKGNTIAKSIEAEDLKVGSRTGASALEVLKNGTFYAKGSNGTNSSLVIDSGTQSIEIVSPYSASWNEDGGSTPSGKSTVKISSQTGGVEVRNDSYDASIVSTNGIFANKAGQSAYPASTGLSAKGAIVGLGFGNMADDLYSDNFIAGVIGRASNSNSNPAPAYGGYFESLRANGLILNMTDISSSSTTATYLYKTQSFVLGNSSVQQNVYLPSDAYKGTVIWLKQWWTGFMRIYPISGQKIYDDSSENSYIDVGEGWMAMCLFIGNWGSGTTKYGTWLINKFKF